MINDDLTVFLEAPLGKGAFGVVFKGSYRDGICAIKLLIYEVVEMQTGFPTEKSEEASKAFDRECELQVVPAPKIVFSNGYTYQIKFSTEWSYGLR